MHDSAWATLNPCAEYQAFKYEQLTDLSSYLEQGDWGFATDATSGFHHFSLHPDMWQYAGFQGPDGQYYVFTVPAFGLAPVPRLYTAAMEVRGRRQPADRMAPYSRCARPVSKQARPKLPTPGDLLLLLAGGLPAGA